MKSPFSFIVEPYNGRRYDNIKKIGDVNLIISSSKEDHTVSNRFAKVISTPINYEGEIIPGASPFKKCWCWSEGSTGSEQFFPRNLGDF